MPNDTTQPSPEYAFLLMHPQQNGKVMSVEMVHCGTGYRVSEKRNPPGVVDRALLVENVNQSRSVYIKMPTQVFAAVFARPTNFWK